MCDHYDRYFPEEKRSFLPEENKFDDPILNEMKDRHVCKGEFPTSQEIYKALKETKVLEVKRDIEEKVLEFLTWRAGQEKLHHSGAWIDSYPTFGEYQLCPLCNGSGSVWDFGGNSTTTCGVCEGKKILARPII